MFDLAFDLVIAAGFFFRVYFPFYKLHCPESRTRRYWLLAAMAIHSLFKAVGVPRLHPWINDFNNSIVTVAGPLVFALLCGFSRRTFFTAVYSIGMTIYLADTIAFLIYGIAGKIFVFGTPEMFLVRLSLVTAGIAWAYFYCRVMRKLTVQPPLSFWLITVIPPVAGAIIMERGLVTTYSLMDTGVNTFLESGLSNGLVLGLNLFIFFMYIRLMSTYEARLENQALQSQLEAQTRQNRLIEGAQKQAGEIRHEMKNLLFGLQIELEHENYAGAKTRIAALLGEMKQYELKPYTMVPVVDAMIGYKGERLREAGAVFSVSADPLYVSDELAYDLASLLAIALDNAIDAYTGISHAETAEPAGFAVRLDISRKKNLMFITVSNPLKEKLKYQGDELQSTKDEPGHGLGIQALRRIVERYSGEVRIKDQDGTFLLEVMLGACRT